ncbi:hypothetical protein XELAEV_18032165mg [Xenopus laevis]|uniref:Uncharacterized protein n=1 Tax=Xenopus laevis TaxID=8355 RepID=A0A974CR94_XENLA|nr:hypothetical protein XELAEV_18032165mg [Xenopus laevis]
MVRHWLQRVLFLEVQPDPMIFIQCKIIPNLKNPIQKLVKTLFTAARCAIARKWKSIHPPSETDFLERVHFIRRMEYLTALRNVTVDRVWTNWDSIQEL